MAAGSWYRKQRYPYGSQVGQPRAVVTTSTTGTITSLPAYASAPTRVY